jgi:hypothetical protein
VICICDYSGEKWLCRLDRMGKSNGPFSPFYRRELLRDSFARCDALQEFR